MRKMTATDSSLKRNSLSNRERGYLLRLEDRCVILRARIANGISDTHFITEWKMELHALEWAIKRIEDAE
jgi:hypothetical protein